MKKKKNKQPKQRLHTPKLRATVMRHRADRKGKTRSDQFRKLMKEY